MSGELEPTGELRGFPVGHVVTIPGETMKGFAAMFDDARRQLAVEKIESAEQAEQMANAAKRLNDGLKKAKAELKRVIDPIKTHLDYLKEKFAFVKTGEDLVKAARDKIGAFYTAEKLRLEREAEEKRQEAEMAAGAAELDLAEGVEGAKVPNYVPDHAEAAKPDRRVAEGASVREHWTYRVVDDAIIPRAYLKVDTAAIQRAVDDGVREIPGVVIEQKATVAFK